MTDPYSEFCRTISERMRKLIALAESRDTYPEEWKTIDSLKELVDSVVEHVPMLDEYFLEIEELLQYRKTI